MNYNRQFSFILARYFGFPPFPPTPTPIVHITETTMLENNIVCFEKNSLGYNIPNKKTYISNYHGIIHNGKLIQANKFVGRLPGIYYK